MELRTSSHYRHLLWITVLVLLVSGTLLFAACGSTSNTNTGTTPTTTQQGSKPTATQQGPTPTSTAAGGGNTYQVTMVESSEKYAFSPATLTIPKGATVIWTNKSDARHTVTSDDNTFTGSSTLSESQTFQMVFATAGTFTYHCAVHSYMKATIIVTA
jgi:plastocyanin